MTETKDNCEICGNTECKNLEISYQCCKCSPNSFENNCVECKEITHSE